MVLNAISTCNYGTRLVTICTLIFLVQFYFFSTHLDCRYNYYWAVYRQFANGIVFVYSHDNDSDIEKLEMMYNYFINSRNFDHRACLVCSLSDTGVNKRLKSKFLCVPIMHSLLTRSCLNVSDTQLARLSDINANLDVYGERFKQEFIKYVVSVVKTMK